MSFSYEKKVRAGISPHAPPFTCRPHVYNRGGWFVKKRESINLESNFNK